MMNVPNTPLARRLQAVERWPGAGAIKTIALRTSVPFLGTAGVRLVSLEPGRAVLALDDRRRVHNHIRGVHGCAAALLAEATSGAVLSYHLPEGRLPLLASMEMRFVRRMKGGLTATATLDEATVVRMEQDAKGEVTFDVEVRDSTGERPLEARFVWAWRTRSH